ncbi:MAG: outer membrane protein assembly factor BamB family protein [Hyphomicrobiales bacterium]
MTLATRIVCTVFALVLSALAAFAAPVVAVAPAVGPPTSKTTVFGTGFGAFAAIDVYFDTTHLCLAFANGVGAVNCAIKVPKDAQPQTHWVSMLQRSTGTGAQKAFLVRTDWAQFHGRNAAHTGLNPFENTLNTGNVADLDTLWSVPIGPSGTESSPVIAGGRAFVGGSDGKLYSFIATTGGAIAGFPKTLTGPVTNSTPAVGFGNVYAGTGAPDNKLYAFNATTGASVAGFPKQLGGTIFASPTLYGGNVYVACADGKVYAFNATTGATVPGFPIIVGIGASLNATVSIVNGRMFVGSQGDSLHAFDALTGAAITGTAFPVVTSDNILSTPAIASAQVFVGDTTGKLYGVRAANGTPLSGFPTPITFSAVFSSPAVGGGRVIFGSADGFVYARRTSDGVLLWSSGLDAGISGSPVIANGVVYINSSISLYALNATNGLVLWRAGIVSAAFAFASPVVANGMVYLASADGNLHAFSVHGELPAAPLGVRPALSSLKPDLSLKPVRAPAR